MLKVICRSNNKQVPMSVEEIMVAENKTMEVAQNTHNIRVYTILCNPCYGAWMDVSEEYMKVINKYRGKAKLEKYKMTDWDKRHVAENPDAIMDIPRLWVPGLDRALGSDALDKRMRAEFVRRYDAEDPDIIHLVNRFNPTYKIVRV